MKNAKKHNLRDPLTLDNVTTSKIALKRISQKTSRATLPHLELQLLCIDISKKSRIFYHQEKNIVLVM
jgi:hypothetical protein